MNIYGIDHRNSYVYCIIICRRSRCIVPHVISLRAISVILGIDDSWSSLERTAPRSSELGSDTEMNVDTRSFKNLTEPFTLNWYSRAFQRAEIL